MLERVSVERAIVIGAVFLFVSTSSVAEELSCPRPTAPTLPSSAGSVAELGSLGTAVESFSGASATYLRCLWEYAQRNREVLSDAERNRLKAAYTSHQSLLRDHAQRWNALNQAFHESRSAK